MLRQMASDNAKNTYAAVRDIPPRLRIRLADLPCLRTNALAQDRKRGEYNKRR
jgi:hypothetical protein